jgi:acyl carrier protein
VTGQDLRDLVLDTLRGIAPEIDPAGIDPSVDLREQIDLDSMDFLNFVTGLRDATGVDIPERDYAHVATIDGCAAYLDRRAGASTRRD